MTNVSVVDNWHVCTSDDEKFLNCLPTTETFGSMQRWKNHDHQVVIKTDDCYYKIYQQPDDGAPTFNSKIREAFAAVYTQQLGIKWNIKTVQTSTGTYQVEQRQPLNVCPESHNFTTVFADYTNILKSVESILCLDQLTEQLKKHIPSLSSIRLVRSAYNKHDDYAYTDDNRVVLLDDSDFFLAMIDQDGQWMERKAEFYSVELFGTNCTFCPLKWEKILETYKDNPYIVDERFNRWTVVFGEIDQANTFNTIQHKLMSFKEAMLDQNIRFLNGKTDMVSLYNTHVKQITAKVTCETQ